MSGLLQSAIKKQSRFAAAAVTAVIITGLLYANGVISHWDRFLYDLCINYRAVKKPLTKNPLIIAVDLDDTSIEELGETLDTRQAFADLMEVFDETNTACIMDFKFGNEKSHDGNFVSAVKQHSRYNTTVIAALAVEKELVNKPYKALDETQRNALKKHTWNIRVIEKGKVPQAGTFLLPFTDLMETAGQVGFINMEPDGDGIYRRAPLLYEWEGGYIPSLPLAAAAVRKGIPVETIELKAGAYLALPISENEVIRIPIDEQGRTLIPYTETWADEIKRIPFCRVVNAKNDDGVFDEIVEDLNGYIALVAETSTSQKDFGPTSFERLYPLSRVHAEVLSGILNAPDKKAFISQASLLFKIIILITILCTAFFCINVRKDAVFHIVFFLSLLVFSCLTLFRWGNYAAAPWFAFPVTMFFFLWLSAFLYRLFIRYKEQLLLRNALSRFFPHALAERIMREGKTDLAPAYKELTILFLLSGARIKAPKRFTIF